jgi:hypothetical protein
MLSLDVGHDGDRHGHASPLPNIVRYGRDCGFKLLSVRAVDCTHSRRYATISPGSWVLRRDRCFLLFSQERLIYMYGDAPYTPLPTQSSISH